MPGDTYGVSRPFFRPFWAMLGHFDVSEVNDYFEFDESLLATREITMGLSFVYTAFVSLPRLAHPQSPG